MPKAFTEIEGVRYALTSNGASVIDLTDGSCIYSNCLQTGWAAKIMAYILQFDGLAETYMDGQCYSDRKNIERCLSFPNIPEVLKDYIRKSRVPVDDLPEFILQRGKPVEKLHMMFEDMDERQRTIQMLAQRFPELAVTTATSFNLEINAPGCNKGSSLIELGRLLGIEKEEIMACGDSSNDAAMLQAVGLSVAMGNASPEIKALADVVTKSNEEDGVAVAIREYVL